MSDGSAVHGHYRLENVAPIRGGRESEPSSCGNLAYGALEGDGWHMVALVNDDQSSRRGPGEVLSASESLCHRDVDAAGLSSLRKDVDLLLVETEIRSESLAPPLDRGPCA